MIYAWDEKNEPPT